MRILIIGATGNSGLALTRMALTRGLDVTAYVRSAEKLQALLDVDQVPGLTIRILKAFKQRMPEMIVTYEDAARVILDNLAAAGPFARKRVGLARPPGQTGAKSGGF